MCDSRFQIGGPSIVDPRTVDPHTIDSFLVDPPKMLVVLFNVRALHRA